MKEEVKAFSPVEMVNISKKPIVSRLAEAVGKIKLKRETVEMVLNGQIKKGDVLAAAEIAGILAAKKTAELIPLCHSIPTSQITIQFILSQTDITSRCIVSANTQTGVEMEALVGVTTALITIWDMVKYLEKDDEGQYPNTVITKIQVTKKWKEET